MIFNSLEFMGAPIDVLIKQFRSSQHCIPFESMAEAATKFFGYLSESWPHTPDMQKRHARKILIPVYARVKRTFDRANSELFRAGKRMGTNKFFSLLFKLAQERVDQDQEIPPAECFNDVTETEIEQFYEDTLDEVIDLVFKSPPLDQEQRSLFRRIGVLALHRDIFSDLLTGFVFAGYGHSEVFPSLLAYHTDGIIAGRLKTKLIDDFRTSRDAVSAKIIPFAQREAVDRFLVGIDPRFEQGIINYFHTVSTEATQRIFDGVDSISTKAKRKILANLRGTLGVGVSDFGPTYLETTKKSYSQETEDMVLFMAKQDSAHLAEALVNITSVKRKYSPDEESVAGPIDVAVISRNDGFVWVKRKHYFPAELNQRYFVRKFGSTIPRMGGENATKAT
jgi:hypothetical protein